ncbi:heme peroxidase [Blyttiomyces helicus]|uniref:Peroxidase n=1 Tax=Blyttiomyces helicus TaxID=388810 RepID=A0A4V1IR06_9FUNG|nr:heme peroxidase [Blyttiomyces helicus]|eukprot:RKO88387.1 heme peroxidase [Blyttiomyces helicus]
MIGVASLATLTLALGTPALAAPRPDAAQPTDFEGYTKFMNENFNFLSQQSCVAQGPDATPFAAIWIRAAFHDIGTFDPTASFMSGADGSLINEMGRPANAGLGGSTIDAMGFQNAAGIPSMSKADVTAFGALATVRACGGPAVRWFPGREDIANLDGGAMDPDGLLPSPSDSYETVQQKFARMGLSKLDMLAVVTGSHSVGGVHGANNPDLTKEAFVPFDNTPGMFDNDVFKQTLKGNCPLPLDCQMANDPELRPHVEKFANDQSAFFDQYSISFEKFLGLTKSALQPEVKGLVGPVIDHASLVKTGTLDPPFYPVDPKPSSTTAAVTASTSSAATSSTATSVHTSTSSVVMSSTATPVPTSKSEATSSTSAPVSATTSAGSTSEETASTSASVPASSTTGSSADATYVPASSTDESSATQGSILSSSTESSSATAAFLPTSSTESSSVTAAFLPTSSTDDSSATASVPASSTDDSSATAASVATSSTEGASATAAFVPVSSSEETSTTATPFSNEGALPTAAPVPSHKRKCQHHGKY